MNRKESFGRFTPVAAGAIIAATGLLIAGPLDPPAGQVSPTYKTLSDVEPRIAINSTNTPGDADSLFRISQPGSYYLTGNIEGVFGKAGIEVATSGVCIDLNGFSLIGQSGTTGVSPGTAGAITNIAIRNGVISGWFSGSGVSLVNATSVALEDLSVVACGVGIAVGPSSTVRNCRVRACPGDAISVGDNSVVRDCEAALNSSAGIRGGVNLLIEGCSITSSGAGVVCGGEGLIRNTTSRSNAGVGFQLGERSTAEACTATGNAGSGFAAGDGAAIRGCTAANNGGVGIFANNGSSIENNLTRANQQDGIYVNFSCAVIGNNCNGDGTAAGNHGAIRAIGQANRIDSNNITYADRGLMIASGGNTIIRNSVKGCTVNFDIVGGNDVGPVGSAATATSPWANIQY